MHSLTACDFFCIIVNFLSQTHKTAFINPTNSLWISFEFNVFQYAVIDSLTSTEFSYHLLSWSCLISFYFDL